MIARSLHNGCDERRGGAVHQQHIWSWVFREILKSNPASCQSDKKNFLYPFQIAFEWRAWRQLRRIVGGEFDVVLRVVPITAVLPSPFAFFLKKGRVDLL